MITLNYSEPKYLKFSEIPVGTFFVTEPESTLEEKANPTIWLKTKASVKEANVICIQSDKPLFGETRWFNDDQLLYYFECKLTANISTTPMINESK